MGAKHSRGAPPQSTAEWVAAAIEASANLSARRRGQVFNGSNRALRDHELRASVKESFVSTVAGTAHVRKAGERVIFGPNGERIKVVELPEGGNQIEHGEHLHAVIRPTAAAVHSRSHQ